MRTNSALGAIERVTTRMNSQPRSSAETRFDRTARAKLPDEVRESLWLAEVRAGTQVRTIAQREKTTQKWVQTVVTQARLRELAKLQSREIGTSSTADDSSRRGESVSKSDANLPRLVPLFPIGPLTPSTTCGHQHPIRAGSVFCCMICHTSGFDDHPAMKRDPQTDPKPEPKASRPATAPARAPKPGQPTSKRPRLKQCERKRSASAMAK